MKIGKEKKWSLIVLRQRHPAHFLVSILFDCLYSICCINNKYFIKAVAALLANGTSTEEDIVVKKMKIEEPEEEEDKNEDNDQMIVDPLAAVSCILTLHASQLLKYRI